MGGDVTINSDLVASTARRYEGAATGEVETTGFGEGGRGGGGGLQESALAQGERERVKGMDQLVEPARTKNNS